MEVAVLGPVRLVRDDAVVDLGTPKQRGLLAALALHAGRPVPPDALVEVLWGDAAPAAVSSSLQACWAQTYVLTLSNQPINICMNSK